MARTKNIDNPQANSDTILSTSDRKIAKLSKDGGVIIGSEASDANNVKLHRGGSGELQVVDGDDTTAEGVDSPNKATIAAKDFQVSQIGVTRQTLADAASIDWDAALGNHAVVTIAGNRVLNAPTNLLDSSNLVIKVVQDGIGSRTLTWNPIFKFPSGTLPVLSTAPGSYDLFSFFYDGTDLISNSFLGPVINIPPEIVNGAALDKSGPNLDVKYDNTTVGVNGSNQLEVIIPKNRFQTKTGTNVTFSGMTPGKHYKAVINVRSSIGTAANFDTFTDVTGAYTRIFGSDMAAGLHSQSSLEYFTFCTGVFVAASSSLNITARAGTWGLNAKNYIVTLEELNYYEAGSW